MHLTSAAALAASLGVSKSTVTRHASRLGISPVGSVYAFTPQECRRIERAIAAAAGGNPLMQSAEGQAELRRKRWG